MTLPGFFCAILWVQRFDHQTNELLRRKVPKKLEVSGLKIGKSFPDDWPTVLKNLSLGLEKEWRYCRRLERCSFCTKSPYFLRLLKVCWLMILLELVIVPFGD